MVGAGTMTTVSASFEVGTLGGAKTTELASIAEATSAVETILSGTTIERDEAVSSVKLAALDTVMSLVVVVIICCRALLVALSAREVAVVIGGGGVTIAEGGAGNGGAKVATIVVGRETTVRRLDALNNALLSDEVLNIAIVTPSTHVFTTI